MELPGLWFIFPPFIQRNFEPLQRQVELWRKTQIIDERAKPIFYSAFIDGALDAPRSLLPEVRHRMIPQLTGRIAKRRRVHRLSLHLECTGAFTEPGVPAAPLVSTETMQPRAKALRNRLKKLRRFHAQSMGQLDNVNQANVALSAFYTARMCRGSTGLTWCEIGGQTPDEVQRHGAMPWFGCMHADDRERVQEVFRCLILSGEVELDTSGRVS